MSLFPGSFKVQNTTETQKIIGNIFITAQRNSTFVYPDRTLHSLMEANEALKRRKKLNKAHSVVNQKKVVEFTPKGDKSLNPKLITKWA